MSNFLKICAVLALLVITTMSKPVKRGPPQVDPVEGKSPDDKAEQALGLAYEHYLKEVVDVLESDHLFKQKLETANITDIKSGKIAMYLELVNHTVRDRLHELKRKELARLSQLARIHLKSQTGMEMIMNAMGRGVKKFEIPDHLDLGNQNTFEIKDLENLIKKTTSDLEKLDEQRKEEFKEYEMEKKFEQEDRLKHMEAEERKKEEQRLEELKKKHKEHPKLHHPGSKDQFEEVWEKDDGLEDQEFNPRTFFMAHDLNGDMEWSIDEVDAVLQRELDKVYDERNSPDEDDPLERDEEMNRMREHVFQEMDKDKNMRITFDEFIAYTGEHGENSEFKKDEGWKTLDEEDALFDDDEYERFLREHHAQPGVVDPPEDSLHFQPEHQQQQFDQHQQQQQFNQHQQNINQNQQHQQQQFNQHQQNQQQQQHLNQQQQQQHLNQQQQQHLNQQQQQHLNQQQQQHMNQQQQQHLNQQQQQLNQQQQQQPPQQNNIPQAQQQQDPQVLQKQLHELQEKLNQQQQQQQQQHPNVVNQPSGTSQQQQGQGH